MRKNGGFSGQCVSVPASRDIENTSVLRGFNHPIPPKQLKNAYFSTVDLVFRCGIRKSTKQKVLVISFALNKNI